MTVSSRYRWCLWLTVGASLGCAASRVPDVVEVDPPVVFPQNLFAQVNGILLHYLDWGGSGDLLLLLPGLGMTAYSWAGIAPAFTDRFRVVSLTRRGHGASDKPASGFVLDTLVNDVVSFIDAIGAERVILMGHSFAGREMPLVAARLGSRARAIVFVDAVYDWPAARKHPLVASVTAMMVPPDSAFASHAALEAWHQRREPETWGPVAAATLRSQTYLTSAGRVAWQFPSPALAKQLGWMVTASIDYAVITVPSLALVANMLEPATRALKDSGYSADDVAALRRWVTESDLPVKRAGIEALRQAKGPVTVVELEAPHVMMWYDPVRVVSEVSQFLKMLPPPSERPD